MIKTEHRGYEIHFSENMDEWSCRDCNVTHQSLLKVKAAIDKLHLKLRKESAVECFEIDTDLSNFKVKLIDAKLIDFTGMKPARSWDRESGKIPFVASVAKRGNKERAARQEKNLSSLAPISAETRAAIDEANRRGQEAREARTAFNEALKAIPRLALDDIGGLIKASDHKFEEGEV